MMTNPVTLPLSDYRAQHVRLTVDGKVATLGAQVDITGPRAWITGKPMTYQNFAPGEPDGRDGPCVIIGIDHVWRDRNCDGETGFICEVE